MKTRLIGLGALIILLVITTRCLEPFVPPEVESGVDLLVVDGFLTTNNTSNIRLTRTRSLSEKSDAIPESGAQLSLEDENGTLTQLIELESGSYSLQQDLSVGEKYRLKIVTVRKNEYLSDFVTINSTPDIDSVYWRGDLANGDVDILLATHNISNGTGKYRWRFRETWEYSSRFGSAFVLLNGMVFRRDPDELIDLCWRTLPSTEILIGSSERLGQDVISDYPITEVPWTSPKMRSRYSILVEQYIVNDKEYEYWQLLKKNTENLGTLFDPLPSQIRSNLSSSSSPDEVVLGYFSIYDAKQFRIFVSDGSVEEVFGTQPLLLDSCSLDFIRLGDVGTGRGQLANSNLINEVYVEGFPDPILIGYNISVNSCMDCRVGGGVNKKPSFWID